MKSGHEKLRQAHINRESVEVKHRKCRIKKKEKAVRKAIYLFSVLNGTLKLNK